MNNKWRFGEREFKYLREVLESGEGSSSTGSMNNRLEVAFAELVGAKYSVTFNSGTGTLQSALDAVGVGAGDEVITTPLTVISNGDVILAQNAIPVFADVQDDTFNIDPESVRSLITERTKAIMPVSLYGLPCDLEKLLEIGTKHGIPIINDAAQAHMASYKGKPLGGIADITSYSLENSKHITTGDGGIVVTNDENYAVKMRKHGSLGYAAMKSGDGRIRTDKKLFQDPNYQRHDAFGYNFRMPELAAAVGLAQVERAQELIELRLKVARMFAQACAEADYLVPQKTPDGYMNTFWTYAVKYVRNDVSWYEFRDKFMEFGGDGVYAAWVLVYNEALFTNGSFRIRAPYYYEGVHYEPGLCEVAEKIQPQLMQFITNYGDLNEASTQVEALSKTINFYN